MTYATSKLSGIGRGKKPATNRRIEAYENIKGAILAGTLRPLERISEEHVAERLGLSRTPVREAFGLLQAEGLIVVVPKRGSFVSQLGLNDLLEIYQIRMPLECMAARLAATALTDDEIKELERYVDTVLTTNTPKEKALALSITFHEKISGSCRNRRLQALLKQLQSQVIRARSIWPLGDGDLQTTWQEHKLLVEAFRKRAPVEAERVMQQHLEQARLRTLAHALPVGQGR